MNYRFLKKPAWLAAMAGVVLLAALFLRLSLWQFDRAHRVTKVSAAELAQREQPVPLASLLQDGGPATDSAIGREVVISGTFDAAHQLLVPDRELDGRTGYIVIAPMKLSGGSAVVVSRGWTARPVIPPAPTGTVQVTGWLSAAESTDGASEAAISDAADDPTHRIAAVDVSALVNLWPEALDQAYVSVLSQDPADPAGLTVVPAPPPVAGTSWNILNLGYTAQWFLFAGVAFWWFGSYVRRLAADPSDGETEEADEEETERTEEDETDEDSDTAIRRSPAPEPESRPLPVPSE